MSTLTNVVEALRGNLKTREHLVVVKIEVQGATPAAAYAANDAVGGVFSVDVPKIGWIIGAKLIDRDDDTLALTAHIYTERFTGAADNAAYTVGVGDSANWLTNITFDTVEDEGSFKVSEVVGETFYSSPSGKLWIQCSTTGTPNIASGALPILQLAIKVAVGG